MVSSLWKFHVARLIPGLVGLALAASVVTAHGSALERLDLAVARGDLSPAAAARQKLLYLFDRARMAPEWRGPEEPPAKCGTALLAELQRNRAQLDPDTRQLLDATLARAEAPGTSSYTTAHFRIEYATSGPDAPIAADVAPANGVPDFVEQTGIACEQAWATEVATLGYTAPAIANGQSARYPVTYQAQDAYGYTFVISGQQTEMVLHPSYAGFPFNDDPEGDVIGALRVTVAHELKHAIQRMYTPWTEGFWLELDAVWIEDVVFDQVNDYVNFIRGPESPFTAPQTSLIAGGSGSYEDCNWEFYLTETLGYGFMHAFWERRRAISPEPPLSTYQQVLGQLGPGFDAAFGEYEAWNFASGERATPGFGYEEAASYPTTPAVFVHDSLPVPPTPFAVNGLAESAHLIPNPDATLSGTPEFTFAGGAGIAWQISILIRTRAGILTRLLVTVSNGAATVQATGFDWADIAWAAVVIANPTPVNPAPTYTLSARAVAPILIVHSRLGDRAESPAPVTVRARVMSGTAALDPGTVSLVYRVNGGTQVIEPMTATGAPDQFGADIPRAVLGSLIEYRIEAHAVGGALASSPAIPGYHAFQVVNVFEPFETSGGWIVGDAGDDAVSGVWQRATPRGTIAAPYVDATLPPGNACFLTQNGSVGGLAGEADVDQGKTTLRSPVFGFYSGGPYASAVARYRRWYSNHVGARPDDVWRVDASNDAGATWHPVETVTLGDNRWVPVTVDLLALFGAGPSQVQFRFVASDSGTSSLVEAALDDFEILAVLQNPVEVPPDLPSALSLGPALPNPSRGRFRLRLTLPRRAPVTASVQDVQARVVKRLLPPGTWLSAGPSWVEWDGRTGWGAPAPAGIYWLEVRTDGGLLRRKLVRLASAAVGP